MRLSIICSLVTDEEVTLSGWEKGKRGSGIKNGESPSVCWLILLAKMTISQKRKPAHSLSSRESLEDPSRKLELKHFILSFSPRRCSELLWASGCLAVKWKYYCFPELLWGWAKSKHTWHKPGIWLHLCQHQIEAYQLSHLQLASPSTGKWSLRRAFPCFQASYS